MSSFSADEQFTVENENLNAEILCFLRAAFNRESQNLAIQSESVASADGNERIDIRSLLNPTPRRINYDYSSGLRNRALGFQNHVLNKYGIEVDINKLLPDALPSDQIVCLISDLSILSKAVKVPEAVKGDTASSVTSLLAKMSPAAIIQLDNSGKRDLNISPKYKELKATLNNELRGLYDKDPQLKEFLYFNTTLDEILFIFRAFLFLAEILLANPGLAAVIAGGIAATVSAFAASAGTINFAAAAFIDVVSFQQFIQWAVNLTPQEQQALEDIAVIVSQIVFSVFRLFLQIAVTIFEIMWWCCLGVYYFFADGNSYVQATRTLYRFTFAAEDFINSIQI